MIFFSQASIQKRLLITCACILLSACANDDGNPDPVLQERALNDTGTDAWGYGTMSRDLANTTITPLSTSAVSTIPGQDADYGRDTAATVNSADGKLGFNFTKLDSNGDPLASQTQSYANQPWSCVKDEVTGLIWEIKTTSGLQNTDVLYTWYNPDSDTNGGDAGDSTGSFSSTNIDCQNTGLNYCRTYEYIEAINAMQLCGYSDWRLPLREELRSIIDYGVDGDELTQVPMIDTDFFPNTNSEDHWTSQTEIYQLSDGSRAWEVHFQDGKTEGHGKTSLLAVRLVRGPE
jgi:hypothetical protein